MNRTTADLAATNGHGLLLPEHHAEIDVACAALRTSAFTDDPIDVISRVRHLERAVLEHMKAEEDFLLPAYARHALSDAETIRATHEELRCQLHQLGIDAELRCIRLDAIDRLVATLREHAAHEDRYLYPWAQASLAPVTKRELFKRMSRALRALAFGNKRHEAAQPTSGQQVAE